MLRRAVLFCAALMCMATAVGAQTVADSAGAAWRAGATDRAFLLYARVLAADSLDEIALHRSALVEAWRERYDTSIKLFDRLLRAHPENVEARIDRGRVFAWAGRCPSASAVFDSLLRIDPSNRAAQLSRAQVLLWASQMDRARASYAALVAADPHDMEAVGGLARADAWSGRLVDAERTWRAALAAEPRNVAALVGLAQTLRWQGRDAAADEPLRLALQIEPMNSDMREQLRWVRLALAPRANVAVVHESDSDDNAITTATQSGAVHLAPRLEVRAEAYERIAGAGARSNSAYGGAATGWLQIEPGWSTSLTLGASTTNLAAGGAEPIVRATVASPGRYPAGVTFSFARSALDATAALIDLNVTMQELSADMRWAVAGFNAGAAVGGARMHGGVSGETNNRWNAIAYATRRIARPLIVGVRLRGFGFEHDLADGYFDPDFYGLAEVTGQVVTERNRWSAGLDIAPGLQKVRKGGEISGSIRGAARVGYSFGLGRQIGFNASYAKSGLQQLSPTSTADYRYAAIGVSAGWTF